MPKTKQAGLSLKKTPMTPKQDDNNVKVKTPKSGVNNGKKSTSPKGFMTPQAQKRKAETPKSEPTKKQKILMQAEQTLKSLNKPATPVIKKSPKVKKQKEKTETQSESPKTVKQIGTEWHKNGKEHTVSAGILLDRQKQDQRNKCTLLVKPLSSNVTEDQLKKLANGVIDVRIRLTKTGKKSQRKVAFIEFKSEKLAEKHFTKLKGASIDGVEIEIVDYVGEKSKLKPHDDNIGNLDPLRLYIGGLGRTSINESDLKKIFPQAKSFEIPQRRGPSSQYLGFAFAKFDTSEACENAHATTQQAVLNDMPLRVMFAKKKPTAEKTTDVPAAKKRKQEVIKAQVNDSDEDDDSDEEDDYSGEDDDSEEEEQGDVSGNKMDDDNEDDGESDDDDDDDDDDSESD